MIPWLLFAALGCTLQNRPPELVSVNGIPRPTHPDWRYRPFVLVERGTEVTIDLEIHDPEGHHVRVWFPNAPPGLTFDPDGTTGRWTVPERLRDLPWTELVLEDTHPRDPRYVLYAWPFMGFGREPEHTDEDTGRDTGRDTAWDTGGGSPPLPPP